MKRSIPEIRIKPGFLLYNGESKDLFEYYKDRGRTKSDKYLPSEKLLEITDRYRTEWTKHEEKILPAMQDVFELEFYKPVIDVHIAPMFIPKSDPLIINNTLDPDQFIDVLTHELFHNLLTDNKTYKGGKSLAGRWMKMYGLSRLGAVHVLIHAGMKYIYLDVHKDKSRLVRDQERSGKLPSGYSESWEYVENHDYKELIEDFKKLYPELADN